jgi:hypothetical protein
MGSSYFLRKTKSKKGPFTGTRVKRTAPSVYRSSSLEWTEVWTLEDGPDPSGGGRRGGHLGALLPQGLHRAPGRRRGRASGQGRARRGVRGALRHREDLLDGRGYGPPGAGPARGGQKRPWRFPSYISAVWRFYMRARGADRPETAACGRPGQSCWRRRCRTSSRRWCRSGRTTPWWRRAPRPACAEAGVRVVSCEKPIHFSLAEADKLIALCEAKGTLFACAQCHYSSPQVSSCLVGGGVGHGRDGTSLSSRLQPYLTLARR